MEKRDPEKLLLYVTMPKRRKSETQPPGTESVQANLMKNVALLSLVFDVRLEQLGLDPFWSWKRRSTVSTGKHTFEIKLDRDRKDLDSPADKVAETLALEFPEWASPSEWKERLRFFQHLPFEKLKQLKEDITDDIKILKHTEQLQEYIGALHYLEQNHPAETPETLEKASEHWLKAILKLKEGRFSYYAARQAADMYCFIMDKGSSFPYRYGEDEHANLPTTWDNAELKAWRLQETETTREKEQSDADYKAREKQEEAAKPLLIQLIRQGKTDIEIQATLEAQKKPRPLIRSLMLDVRCLRLQEAQRHKRLKMEVNITSQEGPEPKTEAEPQLPKCPEDQYWNDDLKKCMPIKPPKQEPEPEQEDNRWNRPNIVSHPKNTTKTYPTD